MASLTTEEEEYFRTRNQDDHDRLMKISEAIFAKDTGIKDLLTKQNVILVGDGTAEKPGIVNVLFNHIRDQEKTEKQHRRKISTWIAVAGVIVLALDRVLALLGIK